MITLFGQHGVADYEAWLSGAREHMSDSARAAQWGIVESSVYRTVDSSGVIVAHKFNDLETAQKYANMMQSPEGLAMVKQMGAKLPFTIWLAEEVEV